MPTYQYEALGKAGNLETGSLEADDEPAALRLLTADGLSVFSLELASIAQQKSWLAQDLRFGRKAIQYGQLGRMAQKLALLLRAGLTLTQSLKTLIETTESKLLRDAVGLAFERHVAGESFGKALSRDERFPAFFVAMVLSGEGSNSLPQALEEVAEYFVRQEALKRRILGQLTYPAILVLATVALLMVIIFFLGPNLLPLFENAPNGPPGLFVLLGDINRILTENPIGALMAFGILMGLFALLGFTQAGRELLSKALYCLPPIRKIAMELSYARFARSISAFLDSGMTLEGALEQNVQGRFGGSPQAIERALEFLRAGQSPAEAFSEFSSTPRLFKELFSIGLESNRLVDVMRSLSAQLEAQANQKVERIVALLTPAITLAIGIGVGGLALIILTAILEVSQVAV